MNVSRHEQKFYISRLDYEHLRLNLGKLLKPDPYLKGQKGYFIRSVYLDTLNNKAVYEKLSGIEFRDKYRLRIYYFDQDWVKLERKRKANDYVQKTTTIISKEDSYRVASGDFNCLLNYNKPAANQLYFDLAGKGFRPVVTVDYYREAYILDYNNIRISFDTGLSMSESNFNLFDSDMLTYPIQQKDVVIMEIKFDKFLPNWLNKIIQPESAVHSAISKYTNTRLRKNEYYFT